MLLVFGDVPNGAEVGRNNSSALYQDTPACAFWERDKNWQDGVGEW